MRRSFAPALVLVLAVASAAGARLLGGTAAPAAPAGASGPSPAFRGPLLFGLGTRESEQAGTAPAAAAALLAAPAERRKALACSKGHDVVNADYRDRIGAACEVVSLRVSRDTVSETEAQHETEVEPDSFAFGSTIVTSFQIGRLAGGGALAIGFATSRDAGRTWRSGVLPRLSSYSKPAGPYALVSDPSVAYDTVHRVWLIASLAAPDRGSVLTVSRSRDGVAWSAPVLATASDFGDYDKEWVSCDNWAHSPFRGRCYLAYVNFTAGSMETRHSDDGGKTWSSPSFGLASLPAAANVNGTQPISQPDGTLLVLYTAFNSFLVGPNEIGVVRSSDGGLTFGRPDHVADLMSLDLEGVRAPPFVSVAHDANGIVYAAWSDCRFQDGCSTDGIVYSRSRNGVAWSVPARVATGDTRRDVDHFVPGLDVIGSGKTTRLAVAYYARPQPIGCGYTCSTNVGVWLSLSNNAGANWLRPQRLNAETMRGSWLADSERGKFLGDYISTSFVRGRPMPVFALAQRPSGGRLHQAIYVTTRLAR